MLRSTGSARSNQGRQYPILSDCVSGISVPGLFNQGSEVGGQCKPQVTTRYKEES
jgi:hypothetical protein